MARNTTATAVATYTWNLTSNLTAVSDAVGTKTFTYDAAERVTAIGYPDGTHGGHQLRCGREHSQR